MDVCMAVSVPCVDSKKLSMTHTRPRTSSYIRAPKLHHSITYTGVTYPSQDQFIHQGTQTPPITALRVASNIFYLCNNEMFVREREQKPTCKTSG